MPQPSAVPESAPDSLAALRAPVTGPAARTAALRAALIYLGAGAIWILASGTVVESLFQDPASLARAETIKGLAYVAVTGVLVYWLAWRALARAGRAWSEVQLRSTRELLEKVLGSVGEAVIVVDPAGRRIVECNATAERVFGYAPGELAGQSTEVLHVDRASFERFGTIGEPVLEAEGVFRTCYRMKRRDGTLIDTENTVTTLRPDLGWRGGVVSVVRDVTEQAQTRQALQDSEARYRLLADHTLDVIWAMDMKLEFTYVNPAIERLLGYTPAEFTGTGLDRVCDSPTLARLRGVIEDIVAHGPGHEGVLLETRLRRRDGSEVPVEVHGTVLFDDDGAPAAVQGTARDITERLAIEAQLRQSQRLEALGQLTGGVAHDFNNLLTIIMGNSEMLAEELADNPDLKPMAEMVMIAARQGGDLTRSLLAFARRQALAPQVVDVNARVADMESMLRRSLGGGVTVELRTDRDLWPALVDPSQLESALLNLCINARDAMPDGGRITISTTNAHLDHAYADRHVDVVAGDYVNITVTDTGCGIAPERLTRVFEPFYSTKQPGKGTGLGLSMVYGFVKQSRGHVNIRSEPGHGTTVELYLPRVSPDAGEAAPILDTTGA